MSSPSSVVANTDQSASSQPASSQLASCQSDSCQLASSQPVSSQPVSSQAVSGQSEIQPVDYLFYDHDARYVDGPYPPRNPSVFTGPSLFSEHR